MVTAEVMEKDRTDVRNIWELESARWASGPVRRKCPGPLWNPSSGLPEKNHIIKRNKAGTGERQVDLGI